MGIASVRLLRGALLSASLIPALAAAPMLRLSSTTVGPVSIAVGAAGSPQTIEAFNAGDGALNLQVSSSVNWIEPSVGGALACTTQAGTCLPIMMGLQTGSLAKGMYTGVVTVSDPNAFDAPQTITVTVQIGGGVPDRFDFYVPPDGSMAEATFFTNSAFTTKVTTGNGLPWLYISLDGVGSFRFVMPYRITARHLMGMPEGSHNGSITITNSSFAPDNKTIPVVLNVTSQPIAQVSPDELKFRVVQDSAKASLFFNVSNRGQGSLQVASVTAAASSGDWLSVESAGGTLYRVSADPAGLALGTYQGSLTVATNAVNGQLTAPVELEIIAPGPPWSYFGGAVNVSTYDSSEPLAKGDIVALFGEQFSSMDPQQGDQLPLVTQLGGATVFVNDQPAPLYFSSYGQMNFQMPYETPSGTALVRVDRDGQRGNTISVEVTDRAARIHKPGFGDYGTILVPGTPETSVIYAMPAAFAAQFGLNGRPAHAGEDLVIYVLGMGQTTPPIQSGVAAPSAEPFARVAPVPDVVFGYGLTAGVSATPAFVGLVPTLVGLYQINVKVPVGAPPGDEVPVHLELGGVQVSNQVMIAVQ